MAAPIISPATAVNVVEGGRTAPAAVVYPESDGKPLGETLVHIKQILHLFGALMAYFAGAPRVFVAADLFLYYVEGDPRRRVAPDVMVVRGIEKRDRDVYLLWQEGKAPDVVFEITSAGTRRQDTVHKRTLYEQLGVQEYFLFDPKAEYLRPPFQAYHLVDGQYEPLPGGGCHSHVLGLDLRLRDGWLRLWDAARNEWLPTIEEAIDARQAAEVDLRAAEAARQDAEARAEALQAELAQLRAQLGQRDDRDRGGER
jgi:Uma2 family endonuclease